jgi:cobalt-zinc-cadmium efflux system membrane fusion protein
MKKSFRAVLLLTSLPGLALGCHGRSSGRPSGSDPGHTSSASSDPSSQSLEAAEGHRGPVAHQVPRRGFGRRTGRGWGRHHVTLTPDEERMAQLSTVEAQYRPLRSRLQAMGRVYAPPDRKAVVSPGFPARVGEVLVRVGQWVRRGQPLVVLSAETIGEAKAAYLKARAALELADSSYEREERLLARGVGARKAFLAAENGRKLARSDLESAEKRMRVLGLSEAEVEAVRSSGDVDTRITLYAPIAGKVTDTTPVVGSMADPSAAILTIVDPRTLCVDAEIYERDLAKLRVGQEVAVRVPAYPGEVFRGRIGYIGDEVKAETRTITVRTEVENHAERLKPGMYADVSLFLEEEAPALALPQRAVLDNLGEKMVFLKTAEGYLPQAVQVGTRQGGYVEIVRGLERGDEVVLEGNYQLKSKLREATLQGATH